MPSRPPFSLSQDGLKDLGHHVGVLDARKPATEKSESAKPKHQGKWVVMVEGEGTANIANRINQTVFSSLVGFALSDICPLWRVAETTLDKRPLQGARTKFIEQFNSLQETQWEGQKQALERILKVFEADYKRSDGFDLTSKADRRLIQRALRFNEGEELTVTKIIEKFGKLRQMETRYDCFNSLSVEALTQKKVPSFCALAKVLGNQDIPPRNWGYTGVHLEDSGKFFMSDIDLSGYYIAPSEGGQIEDRADLAPRERTLNSPFAFPGRQEYFPFSVQGPLETFFYNTPRVSDGVSYEASKSLEAVKEKLINDAPLAQYFQLLFAAAALPDSWLNSLAARYLTARAPGAADPQGLVHRFKGHRNTLKANLHAELEKPDSPFRRLLEENREAWIRGALAHAHKFNLHDCRKPSHRDQRINLEELLGNLKELAGLPRELGPGDHTLLEQGKAEGRDHFLRIKAKEYLQNLEGKARFTRKKIPDTAKKFLAQLAAPGRIDWASWLGELDAKSKKAFGRREETILAYRGLAQLIRLSADQSTSADATSTEIRRDPDETSGVGARASRMMTASPHAQTPTHGVESPRP